MNVKQWPLSRFIELGSWLVTIYDARIIIVGSERQELLGRILQQELAENCINVVVETSLRQVTALLGHCNLFVGNDTGPKHLATSMDMPVIEISFSPFPGHPLHHQSPSRFGPWRVPHRILQPGKATPPCTDACMATEAHCILGVTVE